LECSAVEILFSSENDDDLPAPVSPKLFRLAFSLEKESM